MLSKFNEYVEFGEFDTETEGMLLNIRVLLQQYAVPPIRDIFKGEEESAP